MAKWYQKGQAGKKQLEREKAEREAKRATMGKQRFFLPREDEGKATLIDNPDFYLHEHRAGEKFDIYLTCVREMKEGCVPCEEGIKRSYGLAATCINHRPYTNKEGKTYVNQRQLIVFRGKAMEKIIRLMNKHDGDLSMCVLEFARGSSDTEAATGEDITFLKRISKKQLLQLKPKDEKLSDAEWLEPIDYEKEFAPKKRREVYLLLGIEPPVGSEDEDEDDNNKKPPKKSDKKKPKPKQEEDDDEPDGNSDDEGDDQDEGEGEGDSGDDDDDSDSNEESEPEPKTERKVKPKDKATKKPESKPSSKIKSIDDLF